MEVNGRVADYPIEKLFLERWSPRAYTGETIPDADLMRIFEAARWAPSSYNQQPWRFIYAKRDSADWDRLLGLLVPGNQAWVKNCAALIIVVSKTTMDLPDRPAPVPSHTHSFDAGAAWGYMALQAQLLGWPAHGMIGLDLERARIELGVPDGYRVEAAVAIGRRGDKSMLPEALQAREAPNARRPVAESIMEGRFRG